MSKAYQVITDRILKMLDEGVVPWRQSWTAATAPRSIHGRPYRGVNLIILAIEGRRYGSPYWLTYNQAKKLGGHVRKGEQGVAVVLWKRAEKKDEATGEKKPYMFATYFTVFNVEQCEGLDPAKVPSVPEPIEHDSIAACERIVEGYADGPAFVSEDRDRAWYHPRRDVVNVPPRSSFESAAAYYATTFHELGHSTGHESRLAREGVTDPIRFGSHKYSAEELVAEFTAAFLCGEAGIENTTINNAAAYIASWAKALRDDPTMVVKMAGKAQRAADRVLGRTFEKQESEAA